MKILILSNEIRGLYNFRGALIRALIEAKNDILVGCPEDKTNDHLQRLRVKFLNTPISRRSLNPLSDLKLFFLYCTILVKNRPHLIITYTIKCNIWGSLAAQVFSIPYVSNITGLGTAFQKPNFLRQIVVCLYRCALRNARTVFFENLENLNIAGQLGFVNERQAVLLNGAGVDLAVFKPLPLPPNDTVTKFLMVGRVMREKGIDELIWAASKLKQNGYSFRVTIIGELEENYISKLDELRRKSIIFYEGVRNDVVSFFQDCHVVVLPSHHEGMSNALLEAAACARPIITSDIHGCKETVIHGVSGFLVEKANSSELYEKMATFCSMRLSDIIKMGEFSRRHVERHFNKTDVVEATIKAMAKSLAM